jgi:hypothetical protein
MQTMTTALASTATDETSTVLLPDFDNARMVGLRARVVCQLAMEGVYWMDRRTREDSMLQRRPC